MGNGKTNLLSVKDAAKQLNLSEQRIKQLIYEQRLFAQKIGNQWIIEKKDLQSVAVGRASFSNNRSAPE